MMEDRFFLVGRVIAPWGVQGDVTIEVLSENPDRFRAKAIVYLNRHPHTVERCRIVSKKTVLKFEGINSREDAETLRGVDLEVPESQLMALAPEQYFYHQIVGLRVVTTEGRELGAVAEVFPTGSNDVYVVRGDAEYLTPAIADVVQQIDIQKGIITIEAIPGLLE